MADKVIDFQAAKERIQSSNLKDDEFSIENEMEELTQYIMELTNYMAGISVALSIRDAGVDDWMDALKEQRLGMNRELVEEEVAVQFELDLGEEEEPLIFDFIPEFDLDDN